MASSSSEIPPGADVPEANAAEERARRVNELKDRFTTPMQQIIAFRKVTPWTGAPKRLALRTLKMRLSKHSDFDF